MRGYIIELLVIICRLKLCVDTNKTQKLLEILEHINTHYNESLRVEDLAQIAGYSVSHFRRFFKALTGKTTSQYIQLLRVEEACKLLKDHTLNIEQIAHIVGYSDMKHFYTVFKRISGKNPKDFR
jgi:transcriptional regulator GlxA family with amidase domain